MAVDAQKPGAPKPGGVYELLPMGAPKGGDKEFWGTEFSPLLGKWLAPFIMQVRVGVGVGGGGGAPRALAGRAVD